MPKFDNSMIVKSAAGHWTALTFRMDDIGPTNRPASGPSSIRRATADPADGGAGATSAWPPAILGPGRSSSVCGAGGSGAGVGERDFHRGLDRGLFTKSHNVHHLHAQQ